MHHAARLSSLEHLYLPQRWGRPPRLLASHVYSLNQYTCILDHPVESRVPLRSRAVGAPHRVQHHSMVFSLPVTAQVLGAARDRVLVRPQNASPSPTYLNRTRASGVEGALGAGSRKEVREEGERSGVGRVKARVKANPVLAWRTTVTIATTTTTTSRRDGGQDCCWALGKYAVCPLADQKIASRGVWQGGLAAAGASVVEWRTGLFSQSKGPGYQLRVFFTCEVSWISTSLPPSIRARYKPRLIVQRSAPHGDAFYVRTSRLISARYEILSDFESFFFGPLGAWGWDAVVY
jgi:hypothetical protein